jgi:hypothetical protein
LAGFAEIPPDLIGAYEFHLRNSVFFVSLSPKAARPDRSFYPDIHQTTFVREFSANPVWPELGQYGAVGEANPEAQTTPKFNRIESTEDCRSLGRFKSAI